MLTYADVCRHMQVQRLRQAAASGTAAGAAPESAGEGGGGGHADAKELAGGGLSTGAAGSRGEFARDVEIEELADLHADLLALLVQKHKY
jgi:hypothetical protein